MRASHIFLSRNGIRVMAKTVANRRFGYPWLLFVGALTIQTVEEAIHKSSSAYNLIVPAIRLQMPLFPMPTFTIGSWLHTFLACIVLLLVAGSPFAFRGVRWMWIVALTLLIVMASFDVLVLVLSSAYFHRWMPGTFSFPLVVMAAFFLLRSLFSRKTDVIGEAAVEAKCIEHQMTTKIAHISDVHFESGNPQVFDRLAEALKRQRPQLLIASGDFVDNPWNLSKSLQWLQELCEQCGISAEEDLFVVPGNHDYRILGNIGFRPIVAMFLRKHFRTWWKEGIVVDRRHNITVVSIDSNPICFGFARGRVSYRQIRKLKNQFRRLSPETRNFIGGSHKIAVLHHHPFPVPFEGGNFFLALRNTQSLFQYLAEFGIDLVMHGHKHRAPHTHLSLGTSTGRDRVMEILGAGSATKSGTDKDPRGHNFNLITLEPCGLSYVQQFFAKQPGDQFQEMADQGFDRKVFDRAYRHAVDRNGYSYRHVQWELVMNFEGDRFNEMSYVDVSAAPGTDLRGVRPPSYTVETGHLSNVRLNPLKTSAGVKLEPLKATSREVEFEVVFESNPTESEPVRFSLLSYDFNNVAVNTEDLQQKYPARAARNRQEDYEEKEICEAMDRFSWTLTFPGDFKLEQLPRFEVYDRQGIVRHEWLTRVLQPCFAFAERSKTAFLFIERPPADYRYRISWTLPDISCAESPEKAARTIIADTFRRRLLEIRNEFLPGGPLEGRMAELVRVLKAFASS